MMLVTASSPHPCLPLPKPQHQTHPPPARAQPKTYFLRPDVALTMGIAIAREVFEQKVLGKEDKYKLTA
jgi:hypothetical protein